MSPMKAAARWDEDTPRTRYLPAIRPAPSPAPASSPPPGSIGVVVIIDPPGEPPLEPPCTLDGLPCAIARAALVDEAWDIAERANTLRLRNSHLQRRLDRWLAARGLS